VGTEGDWRENYADYLGCCNALDLALGRVLAKLEEQGKMKNTLFLFTTDHGCHFRTRNSEYKRSCHDNSIRIPLVVSGQGFSGGGVCKTLASNLDLPATCLRAAGLDVPAHYHGVALQDLLAGSKARADFMVQISEDHCGRALRTERWTYSVRAPGWPWGWTARQPACDVYYEDCLYDNEADPHQHHNLATDPEKADLRKELQQRLLAKLREAGEAEPEIREGPVPSVVWTYCSIS